MNNTSHTNCRRIGILGGSFNPVHLGHVILADYLAQYAGLDQVWFMLSPLNPFKQNDEELAADAERLDMLRLAVEGQPRLDVCDIELTLPLPSYTINSLQRLAELYPNNQFSLIIGADNWLVFNKWREHERIVEDFSPIIYPRHGYDVDVASLPPKVTYFGHAPIVELSSTFIRDAITEGVDVSCFVPNGVAQYMVSHNLYKQ